MLKGKEQQVFDQYFKLMGIQKPSKEALTGWTSWYNYFTDISEDKLGFSAYVRALKNFISSEDTTTPLTIIPAV